MTVRTDEFALLELVEQAPATAGSREITQVRGLLMPWEVVPLHHDGIEVPAAVRTGSVLELAPRSPVIRRVVDATAFLAPRLSAA
jgi:hypothetical protein